MVHSPDATPAQTWGKRVSHEGFPPLEEPHAASGASPPEAYVLPTEDLSGQTAPGAKYKNYKEAKGIITSQRAVSTFD